MFMHMAGEPNRIIVYQDYLLKICLLQNSTQNHEIQHQIGFYFHKNEYDFGCIHLLLPLPAANLRLYKLNFSLRIIRWLQKCNKHLHLLTNGIPTNDFLYRTWGFVGLKQIIGKRFKEDEQYF